MRAAVAKAKSWPGKPAGSEPSEPATVPKELHDTPPGVVEVEGSQPATAEGDTCFMIPQNVKLYSLLGYNPQNRFPHGDLIHRNALKSPNFILTGSF